MPHISEGMLSHVAVSKIATQTNLRCHVLAFFFRQENPYDNTNGFQAVGFANVPPTDTGYSNPLYKTNANFAGAQEPLPEQVDIGVTQEDIVLTTDSWQKEQLKGPDA